MNQRALIGITAIIAIDKSRIIGGNDAKMQNNDFFFFGLYDIRNVVDHKSRTQPNSSGRLEVFDLLKSLFQAQYTTSSEEDILQCPMVLATIRLADFRQSIADYSAFSLDEPNESDQPGLLYLRTNIDTFRRDNRAFMRYVHCEFEDSVLSEQRKCIQEDQEDLLVEAQDVEASLRDHLQISVSFKSMQESRLLIEEGKRVRLSTSATSSQCCRYDGGHRLIIVEQSPSWPSFSSRRVSHLQSSE